MTEVANITLGDMLVVGSPPAKLWKALAVVAEGLHPGYAQRPEITPGISYRSCVLCSLTVRDFLRRVGFLEARAAPVCTTMRATENGAEVHSLGIGSPEETRHHVNRWNGHMVVIVADYVIDTTLYHARRNEWPELTGMAALPLSAWQPGAAGYCGLKLLAGMCLMDPLRTYSFDIAWWDNPANKGWRAGPDCERERRFPVVAQLVARFGTWEESAA